LGALYQERGGQSVGVVAFSLVNKLI